ncbi:hypothetical protein JCM14036_00230 [Desulfotomaculum defluvii]
MVAVVQHPNIKLYTHAEIYEVGGYIGNFKVRIKQKAKYVDHEKCTGCGSCWEKCPAKVSDNYNLNMGVRKAIYISSPQAVPNKPVIDPTGCRMLLSGKCGVCQKVCQAGAINYQDTDQFIDIEVGAVVMATGYDLFDWSRSYGEYGHGKYPDVITSLQFERLLNSSGPTGGKILRPSDNKEPKSVVFIKCVGSRDETKGKSYCSRACCMYTAKHAHQVLEKIEGARAYVFYMDVRTPGKGYEEFYQRSVEEGACYIRGRVSKIYHKGEKLVVRGADTLLGRPVEVEADLVVLATAIVPSLGSDHLAKVVGFSTDKDGFYQEAHPKLKPVETNTGGIFLSGCCQGPKDIPDTVSQASAAAAKVIILLSKDELATNPMVSQIDERRCTGCLACQDVCPFNAIEAKTIVDMSHGKETLRTVASINTGLCQGCGACSSTCRCGAADLKGFTNQQIIAEIKALCL